MDRSKSNPAIVSAFTHGVFDLYWTSTKSRSLGGKYTIDAGTGELCDRGGDRIYRVRCVRDIGE